MGEITEVFTKVNDYTLQVEQRQSRVVNNYATLHTCCRNTFNFFARQVKTEQIESLYVSGTSDGVGRSAQQNLATSVQGFDDLSSSLEVKFMHEKLVELGGKPPSLEDILPNEMHKKPVGVPTLGKGQG